MRYETQTIPYRSDGRPMGPLGALDPSARPGGRPRKTNMREVVNAIFYLTRRGLYLAGLAPRLPALEDRLQLLRVTGSATAPGTNSSPPCGRVRGRPPAATPSPAWLHRQPVGQDRLRRTGGRHRRRQEGPWSQTPYRRGHHGFAAGRRGHGRQRGRRPSSPGGVRPDAGRTSPGWRWCRRTTSTTTTS